MEPTTMLMMSLGSLIVSGVFGSLILCLFLRMWGIDWKKQERMIGQLHEWHDQKDSDGVRVWYVRRSLEDTMNRLADLIERQNEMTTKQTLALDKLIDRIERIEHKIEEIVR